MPKVRMLQEDVDKILEKSENEKQREFIYAAAEAGYEVREYITPFFQNAFAVRTKELLDTAVDIGIQGMEYLYHENAGYIIYVWK